MKPSGVPKNLLEMPETAQSSALDRVIQDGERGPNDGTLDDYGVGCLAAAFGKGVYAPGFWRGLWF